MGKKVTDLVKIIIDQKKDINIGVDMTAGKGNDCKYILENTNIKKLYAFDIQEESKIETKSLIKDDRLNFFLDNHANIDKYIKEKIDLAIYNLGYLPGADKNITTSYKSTIASLKKVLDLLNPAGLVIITVYPGHPAGLIESQKLEEFTKNLDPKKYPVIKINYENRPNNPPYILVIEKAA